MIDIEFECKSVRSTNESCRGEYVYAACCRIDRLVRSPFSDGGPCRVFRSSATTIGAEHNLHIELSAEILAKMLCLTAGSA
jgi:hypothetical protein